MSPSFATLSGLAVLIGQFLAFRLWRNEPNPYIALEVVVAAFGVVAERLRAFEVGHAQQIERDDMRELQRRTEEVEAKPKPGRIVGGARVRCAVCDELVDAATTTRDPERGIVCPDC